MFGVQGYIICIKKVCACMEKLHVHTERVTVRRDVKMNCGSCGHIDSCLCN